MAPEAYRSLKGTLCSGSSQNIV